MKTNKISEKQNKNGGEINMAENQSKKKFSTVFGSSSHSYPESERLQRKPNKRAFFFISLKLLVKVHFYFFLIYLFHLFIIYSNYIHLSPSFCFLVSWNSPLSTY